MHSFGVDGLATVIAETANEYASAVQKNDDIILGGFIFGGPFLESDYPALAKFKADGLTDSIFGENGLSVTITESQIGIYDIALQEDGKIVVVGSGAMRDEENSHFFIARYENDYERTPLFVRLKRWLHHHGFTWDDCPPKLCNSLNYYTVERSANGNTFNEIARIFKSKNQQQYSYEDAAPLSGTNYYRLAAVSSDGSVVYSNIIAVEDNAASVKLYPNPVKNNLHIEGLSATQKTKLTIVDFTGNTKAATIITGSNYNWNIAQLKPGNYMLRIETNGGAAVTKKFVKE